MADAPDTRDGVGAVPPRCGRDTVLSCAVIIDSVL
jgi:hypothetical protein